MRARFSRLTHATRRFFPFGALLALVVWGGTTLVAGRAAGTYPLALALDATLKSGATTVTSTVEIRVDRLMEESRRKRVTDALTYNGYGNFFNVLRTLPAVGTIAVKAKSVQIRYAREQPEGEGRRVVLVADKPLVFLNADATKVRAGYELTVVDLHFDAAGAVNGTMAAAARVKPSPDGVILDDYAETPVQLSGKAAR